MGFPKKICSNRPELLQFAMELNPNQSAARDVDLADWKTNLKNYGCSKKNNISVAQSFAISKGINSLSSMELRPRAGNLRC
jgi:hypothetical protein